MFGAALLEPVGHARRMHWARQLCAIIWAFGEALVRHGDGASVMARIMHSVAWDI